MNSKTIKYFGAALLFLTLVLIASLQGLKKNQPAPAVLKGYLGGEKIGIFEDPEIRNYIRKQYKLTLNYQKSGSYDMVRESHEGKNYLFPASQGALEYYRKLSGKNPQNEIIYNTPLVIYTRPLIASALSKKNIVTEQDGIKYLHMDALVQLMLEEKTWADIGLGQLYGSISVDSTDPASSNSGNMFAALLANTINNGKPVSSGDIAKVLPGMKKIYSKFGFMETSSADMFHQFLKKGVGAYPMIAAYENQLLEFAVSEPEIWQSLKDEIVLLYPVPTMWSTHVYIALDDTGQRGMKALLDPKVQELSWQKHGFRTGAHAAQETQRFNVNGVAKEIISVTEVPDESVLEKMIAELR